MREILLDTDIMSHILTGRGGDALKRRLDLVPPALRYTSAITVGELLYGMERSRRHALLRDRLEYKVLPFVTILPFDEDAAREYAIIRATLEQQGQPLEEPDMRIAATAIVNRLDLITGNDRHFRRVPGLRVYNWLRED